jgi:ATP-dependent DNA helicase RecQ
MAETATNFAINSAAKSMGYKELKEEQLKAVTSFLGGSDVFVTLPTGFGKSLCFAILPNVFDILFTESGNSIVVVLTPLTAIIQNQVYLRTYINNFPCTLVFLTGCKFQC